MAKAVPESASTFVALKVVLIALEAIPDESAEGARRLVIEGCRPGGSIRWKCSELIDPDMQISRANPPADFWRGHLSNFVFSHSDVTNRAVEVNLNMPPSWRLSLPLVCAATLRNVSLAWEDVAALRPEIGPPPASATKCRVVAARIKKAQPQPQAERARWALRRLYPDGRLPAPAELSTKALQQKIATELKLEPRTKSTPLREPPSWDTVDRVRKESLFS